MITPCIWTATVDPEENNVESFQLSLFLVYASGLDLKHHHTHCHYYIYWLSANLLQQCPKGLV